MAFKPGDVVRRKLGTYQDSFMRQGKTYTVKIIKDENNMVLENSIIPGFGYKMEYFDLVRKSYRKSGGNI